MICDASEIVELVN